MRWTRLEILGRSGGGLLETEGTVEFRAHHVEDGRAAVLRENSRFRRDGGRWLYLEPVPGAGDGPR